MRTFHRCSLLAALLLTGCTARSYCETVDCDETAASTSTASSATGTGDGTTSSASSGSGGAGSGGAGAGGEVASLVVTPGDTKVGVLRALSFASNRPVTWAVTEPEGGTIDAAGRYLSPEAPGVFHVVATSTDDGAESAEVEVTVAPLGLEVDGGLPGGAGNLDGIPLRARFDAPRGFAALPGGDYLVADTGNHTIRIYRNADGEVSTLAGRPGSSGFANGAGADALFDHPNIVATDDATGRVFVADGEDAEGSTCIRAIVVATGQVTTLAGACGVPGDVDGVTGAQSRFAGLQAMVATSQGLLTCQVTGGQTSLRIVDVTTGATTGRAVESFDRGGRCFLAPDPTSADVYVNAGGVGRFVESMVNTDALPFLGEVAEIPGVDDAIDGLVFSNDHLYLLDRERPGAGQQYTTTLYDADVTDASPSFDAIAGGEADYVDGTPFDARLLTPGFLVADGNQLYFGDLEGHTVRRVDFDGVDRVETVLGARANIYPSDGPASSARLVYPANVAEGASPDEIYVSGGGLERVIRRVDRVTGAIADFSGVREPYFLGSEPAFESPRDGAANDAVFGALLGMVRVGESLYVVDSASSIRQVDLGTGVVETIAGQLDQSGFADGVGSSARLDLTTFVGGLATDGVVLFIADGGNFAIRKLDLATGEVSTIAGGTPGTADGSGEAAQFLAPSGLTYDDGFLYVADTGAHTIRRIDVASGEVVTLTGQAGAPGEVDGGPSTARFAAPIRVVADGIGNLYVTSLGVSGTPHTIRRIRLSDATTLPFAGDDVLYGFADGPLPATLGCPAGLAVDAAGDLLFADTCDGAVGAIRAL